MADITEVDYIWKNGEMIPWAEATTHVLSPVSYTHLTLPTTERV